MQHGIAIPESEKNEMLNFLTTSRDDVDHEPPTWVEWSTASDTESSAESHADDNSSESSSSSDEEEEYRPFLHLPPNPDGRRCRCGSTTHMTVNSFACPLNPRNTVARDGVAENDANSNENEITVARDDVVETGNDGVAENDASSNENEITVARDDVVETANDGVAENDASSNENDKDAGHVPVRRRRLGLPTRRRRRRSNVANDVIAPPPRRPRIEKDPNVELRVGTAVASPGTRWNLPASTMYQGIVVAVKKKRVHVKWQDGVVEYMNKEHAQCMCVDR